MLADKIVSFGRIFDEEWLALERLLKSVFHKPLDGSLVRDALARGLDCGRPPEVRFEEVVGD